MLPAVIKPYTFDGAGHLQSIFIDPSQSEVAACYFKRKGRGVSWDYLFVPQTEHKRIKWMSKADVRKADCHPSKLKARTWAEARADRRMRKLRARGRSSAEIENRV